MTSSATHVDATPSAVLDELVSTRWSCRAFRPEPLDESTIDGILSTASRAPSWCNTQPWHVHLTYPEATARLAADLRARVAEGPKEESDLPFPPRYEGVYAQRRKTSGWQLYESLGIEKGDRAASARQMLRNFDFFDAPHVAIITTDRTLGVYGAVDCGLFVQSFLLAAHSVGVGAVPQAALASQAPVIREFFGIPEDRLVLLGVSFGRPDPEHPANGYRTERQRLDEMVTRHEK